MNKAETLAKIQHLESSLQELQGALAEAVTQNLVVESRIDELLNLFTRAGHICRQILSDFRDV